MTPETKETKKSKPALRDTAKLILINTVAKGTLIQSEEKMQNTSDSASGKVSFPRTTFQINDSQEISKIHIIGTVLNIEKQGNITNILIDDGTGSIIIRLFEPNKKLETLATGKIVRCIGRIREYNNQLYVFPEIIKETTAGWIKYFHLKAGKELTKTQDKTSKIKPAKKNIKPKVKKKECKIPDSASGKFESETSNVENKNDFHNLTKSISMNQNDSGEPKSKIKKISQETKQLEPKIQTAPTEAPNLYDTVIQIIKDKDSGQGVPIESIIQETKQEKTNLIIEKMLEQGDIFQNAPGKVKVL